MRIAIVASNHLSLQKDTKKGTEIIVHTFVNYLVKHANPKDFQVTAFASGDSDLQAKIESVGKLPSVSNEYVMESGKQVIFELALLSKSFSKQDQFDLYHINIGDGDIALPFAPFVKKPILITLYHPTDVNYAKEYFSLFNENKNVFFVSPTEWQRKHLPFLPYIKTIYHGIDPDDFKFDQKGGESIMWAGRAIPLKGMDIAFEIALRTKHPLNLFALPKDENREWFEDITKKIRELSSFLPISLVLNKNRLDLAIDFQKSRLFLFPISWEEPFGLVMAESMSCGTPVVAYARGSVPEVIKDGKTGFIVNSSEADIRGNWIIKKTGVEGLIEAVERIYSMPETQYLEMRRKCRERAAEKFTVGRMVREYEKVYRKIVEGP